MGFLHGLGRWLSARRLGRRLALEACRLGGDRYPRPERMRPAQWRSCRDQLLAAMGGVYRGDVVSSATRAIIRRQRRRRGSALAAQPLDKAWWLMAALSLGHLGRCVAPGDCAASRDEPSASEVCSRHWRQQRVPEFSR